MNFQGVNIRFSVHRTEGKVFLLLRNVSEKQLHFLLHQDQNDNHESFYRITCIGFSAVGALPHNTVLLHIMVKV